MNGLEASLSSLQLSGRGGLDSGGLQAGLELECTEVCVRQHALVSALTGLGKYAGIFNTLRCLLLLTIAMCSLNIFFPIQVNKDHFEGC